MIMKGKLNCLISFVIHRGMFECRQYKSGYVWQDLMDDELITPVSDNEYVLMVSELSSKTDCSLGKVFVLENFSEPTNSLIPDTNFLKKNSGYCLSVFH